ARSGIGYEIFNEAVDSGYTKSKTLEENEMERVDLTERQLVIPDSKKVISLVGPRRAGKTFYFYQLINNLLESNIDRTQILYINFEDDRILPLKSSDLNAILEAYYELYPGNTGKMLYLFFDEIQNVDNWEIFIRRIDDTKNAKIYITGSSSKLLSQEIATSLRGRTLSYHMYTLGFEEFLRLKQVILDRDFEYTEKRYLVKNLFNEYLYTGGYPEVVLESKVMQKEILRNYFEMIVYRDIVERFSIRNTILLKNLLKFLITNISSPFSLNAYYRAVKKDLAVGKETIIEYLSHLEDINVIYLVPFFSYSLKKQQANPRKVYCADNGLRNAVSFSFSKDEGRLAENLVFLELKRRGKEPYYWKNTGEVDFVFSDDENMLHAVNVSYTDDLAEREMKALFEFAEEFGTKVKDLILLTKDTEKSEDGIRFVPLWKWMLGDY
ncbi:MAG TPA: ATP-binding protein, partial [Methanosarcinaceae archaeon]|nr:ATP-binding protein [Methanosarcinaceae archaeon]